MYDSKKTEQIKKWLAFGAINIFGRPFSGKDFQGRRLAEMFGGNLVGGGEILRSNTMPEHVKDYMHTGKLIPSSDYGDIVLPYLSQSHLDDKPLILSSVGRWYGEQDSVIKALEISNHPLKAIIYLDISNNESRTRWLAREINNDRGGRHDDTEELLNIRFVEFQEKTMPVIDYYRDKGLLIKVDGKGARDEITRDIINALFEFTSH